MREVVLGKTGIKVPQNGFGALPIQRVDEDKAAKILLRAFRGGMRLFDTARAYSDSEKKLGLAFSGMRDKVIITTKTGAKTPDQFWRDLETSLDTLGTDYIDVYQFHMAPQCFAPGDGTGLYECMESAKRQGMIRHIGITCHLIGVAEEVVKSGLYETLQYPFSYLSGEREIAMVRSTLRADMGFLCMKALAGGLINDYRAAYIFVREFENAVPLWGIQKDEELDEWLSLFDEEIEATDEIKTIIKQDREELSGEFCRGCGYCAPCSVGIQISSAARMSLMVRRAVIGDWLNEANQALMARVPDCIGCGVCMTRCPYGLNIPELLRKNYLDYQEILKERSLAASGGRTWLS